MTNRSELKGVRGASGLKTRLPACLPLPSRSEPLSMAELLALADSDAQQRWDALRLSYTETQGLPALREAVAAVHYSSIRADQLVVAAPQELVLLTMQASQWQLCCLPVFQLPCMSCRLRAHLILRLSMHALQRIVSTTPCTLGLPGPHWHPLFSPSLLRRPCWRPATEWCAPCPATSRCTRWRPAWAAKWCPGGCAGAGLGVGQCWVPGVWGARVCCRHPTLLPAAPSAPAVWSIHPCCLPACSAADGSLAFRMEDAEALIGGAHPPKLVVVNSPHNPSVRCPHAGALPCSALLCLLCRSSQHGVAAVWAKHFLISQPGLPAPVPSLLSHAQGFQFSQGEWQRLVELCRSAGAYLFR